MDHRLSLRRAVLPVFAAALLCSMALPTSAFFWSRKSADSAVSELSKNGLLGETISFSQEDFSCLNREKDALASITLTCLPDPKAGALTVGEKPVQEGDLVAASALAGLRFQVSSATSLSETCFTFRPTFDSGAQGEETTFTLYLLSAPNEPPIARNMDLNTYRNVSITGYFDAVDTDGDVLKFQLTSTPARGAITLAEDGSSRFVYSPYENKSGKDTFTYVAIDPAGNTSPEATVTVQIRKPDTNVTYADLSGSDTEKAAIHLAEKNIFVGQCMQGQYFFEGDRLISRAEFLTMAMAAAGQEPLEGVVLTGFSDDDAIPTWAKGSVSAALKAGVIQGCKVSGTTPAFGASENITLGEATVMLNRLLNLADVPAEVFAPDCTQAGHWAGQAAANLAASGIIPSDSTASQTLAQPLTRGDAAQLLDGALDVWSARG